MPNSTFFHLGAVIVWCLYLAVYPAFAQLNSSVADRGGYSRQPVIESSTSESVRYESNASAIAESLAIDSPQAIHDFRLNVGDTFTVNIWGKDLQFTRTYTVPFEGRIFLPQFGEIPVIGLTTAQVRNQLASLMNKRHTDLNVSVLLSATRPIKVFVTGLVNRPGVVTVPAISRLSAALDRADGILSEGSQRRIRITRADSASLLRIDLYRFLIEGEIDSNPLLKAGDVINVPPVTHLATLTGAVHRPGTYEFLPGDTLADLLVLAHGPKPDAALSQGSLVNLQSMRKADRVERHIDLTADNTLKRKLQHLDQLTIPNNTLSFVSLPRTQVTVAGAVAKSGTYVLTLGTRLRDALALVGGIKPGSGLHEVRIYHKVRSGEARFENPTKADAYKLLFENDESQNIQLQDGDLVLVPDSKDLAEDSAVYVHGQVGNPGKIPYRSNDRLSDYLNKSGGPLPRANLRRIIITRASTNETFAVDAQRILREGHFEEDPILRPGDIVDVPEEFFYFANFHDVVNIVSAVASTVTIVAAAWSLVNNFRVPLSEAGSR
ncbi:MAG: SLBB domain-containing protein [Cyanobacteria bacterium NC_groundwater_1444_Ag_S-0.65um_54_12]|nr:SLBB domain-containing protein [Cyanobacteria bacterium NC_groundwater_1444_Ag_S-0.65um_54_12]